MSDYQRCIHFRGIQNVCGAGIDPATLRDVANPGLARWPCLTPRDKPEATTVCPLRQIMTDADHQRENDAFILAADRHDHELEAGRCPTCGKDIEPSQVVGACRYAACGHRLGQVARRIREGG